MRSILKDRNRSGKEGAVAEAEDTINRRARGLDRAFEILDFLRLQRQPLRPNEIAQGIGAPRSSVYELVNLLIRQGIIEYRGDDGRVFLGRKLYFLGAAYAEQFDLMRESEHLLARIAEETRETAQMCQLEGNKYAVVLMNEGSRPFRISTNIGEPVAIPWTASGRLLVDHMSDEEILALIPQRTSSSRMARASSPPNSSPRSAMPRRKAISPSTASSTASRIASPCRSTTPKRSASRRSASSPRRRTGCAIATPIFAC